MVDFFNGGDGFIHMILFTRRSVYFHICWSNCLKLRPPLVYFLGLICHGECLVFILLDQQGLDVWQRFFFSFLITFLLGYVELGLYMTRLAPDLFNVGSATVVNEIFFFTLTWSMVRGLGMG
jgi:hypothetical protein